MAISTIIVNLSLLCGFAYLQLLHVNKSTRKESEEGATVNENHDAVRNEYRRIVNVKLLLTKLHAWLLLTQCKRITAL